MLLHLLNLFIKIGRILYYLFFYFCFSKKSLLLYFSKVELLCELGENLKTDPSPQGEKCQHTVAIPQKSTIYVCACARSCLTHCDPVDCLSCSPPDSSVHGILQTRILEWVAISYSRGSFPPRDRTHVCCLSCTGRQVLSKCATQEAPSQYIIHNKLKALRNPAGERPTALIVSNIYQALETAFFPFWGHFY